MAALDKGLWVRVLAARLDRSPCHAVSVERVGPAHIAPTLKITCSVTSDLVEPGKNRTRTVEGRLAGNGASMLDVDEAFPGLPDSAPLILRVRSRRPTRKNLINRHPDGSLGVDHFPNLV